MSLLESRRGIAQAEGVTRLTELAFIFIPLSFVASTFSMQIHELEPRVPLADFIIVSVVTTLVIYSVRVLVSTGPFKRAKRAVMAKARKYNGLSPNDPVPFSKFVMWLARELAYGDDGRTWQFWLIVSAVALSVVPTVFLWTRQALDVSFRAVGTLILVPMGFTFTWLFVSNLDMSETAPWWGFWAIQNRAARWIGRERERRRRGPRQGDSSEV
ncbi:hypothetical protein CC80DRAFT_9077 [Byssothecium circinans]|uniref:Uncharacterized protein n=1 Tax=Byssothecium circinans TaxID=147558 RepID=A0A6A5UGW3_9PLEO|nr:hypothetical protein CC80DRAFT_9077 [Byssothecium circinans]